MILIQFVILVLLTVLTLEGFGFQGVLLWKQSTFVNDRKIKQVLHTTTQTGSQHIKYSIPQDGTRSPTKDNLLEESWQPHLTSPLLKKRLSNLELYQVNHLFFYGVKPNDPLYKLKSTFLSIMASKENITSADLVQLQHQIASCLQSESSQRYYFGKFKERLLNNRINAIVFVQQKISHLLSTSVSSKPLLIQWNNSFQVLLDRFKLAVFEVLSSSDWSLNTHALINSSLRINNDLQEMLYDLVRPVLKEEVLQLSTKSRSNYFSMKRMKIFGKILTLLGTSPTKFTSHPSDIIELMDQFIGNILSQRYLIFNKVDHQFIYDLFYIQNDRFENFSQPLQKLMMESAPGGEIFQMIYERKKEQGYHHKFYSLTMMYLRLPSFDIRKTSMKQIQQFLQLFEEELRHCNNIDEELSYFYTLYLIQFYHLHSSLTSLLLPPSTDKTSFRSEEGMSAYKDVEDRLILLFFNRFPFLQTSPDSSDVIASRHKDQYKFESLSSSQFSSLLRIMHYILEKCKHSKKYFTALQLPQWNVVIPSSDQALLVESERFDEDQAFEDDRLRVFEGDKLSDISNDEDFREENGVHVVGKIVRSAVENESSLLFHRSVFLQQLYNKLSQSLHHMKGMQIFWTLQIFKNLKIRWTDIPSNLHRPLTEAIYLSLLPIVLEDSRFFYQILYLLKHELQHPDIYCPSMLLARCLQMVQLLMRSNQLSRLSWRDINAIFYFMFPALSTVNAINTNNASLRFNGNKKGQYDDLEVLQQDEMAKRYELVLRSEGDFQSQKETGSDTPSSLALPIMQQNIIERLIPPMIEISQRSHQHGSSDAIESPEAARAMIKYYSSQVLSAGRILSYMASASFPRIQPNLMPSLRKSILALLTTFTNGIKSILLAYRSLLIENDFQLSVIFPPPLYKIFTSVFIVLSKFRIPFQSLPTLQQGLLLFLCYQHEDKVILSSLLQSFLYCIATSNEEIERKKISSSTYSNYVWQIHSHQRKRITWNLLPQSIKKNTIEMIEELLKKSSAYETAFQTIKGSQYPYAIPVLQLVLSLKSMNFTEATLDERLSVFYKSGKSKKGILNRMIAYIQSAKNEFHGYVKDPRQVRYFSALMAKLHSFNTKQA